MHSSGHMCRTGETEMEARKPDTERASGRGVAVSWCNRPLGRASPPLLPCSAGAWGPSATDLREPSTDCNWPQWLLQSRAGLTPGPARNRKGGGGTVLSPWPLAPGPQPLAPSPWPLALGAELLNKMRNKTQVFHSVDDTGPQRSKIMSAFSSLPLLHPFSYFFIFYWIH